MDLNWPQGALVNAGIDKLSYLNSDLRSIWDMSRKSDFQCLSDAVRFIMCQKGFTMIDYIDEYVGICITSVVHASYVTLLDLMSDLCLTVSQKKLAAPST